VFSVSFIGLERILTMVYAVQNYKAYFELYPTSGIYKKTKHNLSEIHLRKETDPVSETLWFLPYIYQPMDRAQNKPNSSVSIIVCVVLCGVLLCVMCVFVCCVLLQ
jgi:hypothetical protein